MSQPLHLMQQQQQFLQQQHHQSQHGSPSTHSNSLKWGAPFPSLHLWPLHDTFVMKMIHLPEGQRIKIGRQTNPKTMPGEKNAYFDSKVLSRTHAEIWEENGRIFIRDVKSSNGTFVNSDRLSPEGLESEPFELKSEDVVEFGIDIVSEDNRTIIHHKIAAKIYCVFNAEDAALSAREASQYLVNDSRGPRRANGYANGQTTNGNTSGQVAPMMTSAGGKASGLSFDHVLHKLQAELQKSRETGAELHGLTSAMSEIQETLGGGLPPSQNGSAVQFIPPQFRSSSAEAQAALASPHGPPAAAFIALQSQLSETQSSLSDHLSKIRQLESQLKQHESIKDEVTAMREQLEASKREMDIFLASNGGRRRSHEEEEDDDDDDARSVITLVGDEDAEQRLRERRRQEKESLGQAREARGLRQEGDRPRTPNPGQTNGDEDDDVKSETNGLTATPPSSTREQEIIAQNAELASRIQTLSTEMAEALQFSRTLQTQHDDAMSAVKLLTERVGALESGMADKVTEAVSKAEERWESWRLKFEDGWKRERESWEAERERLRGVVREWEEASRRAHEEAEEREMNDHLSEDEYVDEEEDEGGEDVDERDILAMGDGWEGSPLAVDIPENGLHSLSPSRVGAKARRRRPSARGVLAIRALKAVAADAGSSTPKQSTQTLVDLPKVNIQATRSRPRGGGGIGSRLIRGDLGRRGSASTLKVGEKDSSESGKESGDTLKEGIKSAGRKEQKQQKQGAIVIQPIPIVTVAAFAIIAGALYYHHKN